MKKYFPVLALVLANLVPLIGVRFFGWDLLAVVGGYWLENVVVGFYNVLKMRKVSGRFWSGDVLFFMAHFGIFTFIHGLFVLSILNLGASTGRVNLGNIDFGVLFSRTAFLFVPLLISHGISFYNNFIQKQEYKNTTTEKLFYAPYGRVVFMQIVIMAGGFVVARYHYFGFVYVFVVLKIFVDLVSHYRAHSNLS